MNWHWFNWVVILLYFIGMFMVGIYFSRRANSTEDYFKAGIAIKEIDDRAVA